MIYLAQDYELTGIATAIRQKSGSYMPLVYTSQFISKINNIELKTFNNGLKVSVVKGTNQPLGGIENLIWVNTDNNISSIAISYFTEEPSEPTEGLLWIGTAVYSNAPFYISASPSIKINPRFAKLYVSGAWVDLESQTYINGAWVKWGTVLFSVGDSLPSITGSGGTCTLTASGVIEISSAADYATNRYIAVDVTNYSKLMFRGRGQRSGTTTDETAGLCSTSSTTNVVGGNVYPPDNGDGMTTDRIYDISDYVGNYRIHFYAYSGSRKLWIYHIELIP